MARTKQVPLRPASDCGPCVELLKALETTHEELQETQEELETTKEELETTQKDLQYAEDTLDLNALKKKKGKRSLEQLKLKNRLLKSEGRQAERDLEAMLVLC